MCLIQFDELQQLWYRWWQLQTDELDGKSLAKEKMSHIVSVPKIAQWVEECDHMLYTNLTNLLIPNVLRAVSSFDV